jgi:hypothetical protein
LKVAYHQAVEPAVNIPSNPNPLRADDPTARPASRQSWPKRSGQGKRITRGKLVKMGKGVSKDAFSKILRKQGVFEIRPYNRLIVLAIIVSSDIPMSLEKRLEN